MYVDLYLLYFHKETLHFSKGERHLGWHCSSNNKQTQFCRGRQICFYRFANIEFVLDVSEFGNFLEGDQSRALHGYEH